MADSFTRSYRSFSGVDIQATFGNKRIGTLQGISYTVTREKAPQYVMGSVDPLSFSRGKRGIAGSLIFLIWDRSNLITAMGDLYKFYADTYDVRRQAEGTDARQLSPGVVSAPGRGIDQDQLAAPDGEADGFRDTIKSTPWYHDQIPPFDITLTAQTEYGLVSRMAIHGVEILNAGSGISIDDITTDENMTFVATEITPWQFVRFNDDKRDNVRDGAGVAPN